MALQTPIVFLIFNRPDLTEQVFETIRQAQPEQLHVVADGPRADRPGEIDLCMAARKITEQVDWPCKVTRDYAEVNMGCGRRVSSGITGAFQLFEEAIILEDDCLPDPSFFPYCSEMLARYKNVERVMHIAGSNFQPGRRSSFSYYYSKYVGVWGWATWRRAWQYYDFKMTRWPDYKASGQLESRCPDPLEREYWEKIFENMASFKSDTWDYQWVFTCWHQSGISAIPEVNLISNIGNRPDGTHYTPGARDAGLPSYPIGPIIHPPDIDRNIVADKYFFDYVIGGNAMRTERKLRVRLRKYLRRIAGRGYRYARSFGIIRTWKK